MAKKVAVIGAGPSGLACLYHLTQDPDSFIAVGFEKAKEVGGLWNYSDYTETDEYGLPCLSSLYKTLKINVAKEIMGFPQMDFPAELPSYFHHSHVKKYMDDFSQKNGLQKFIKFQTMVTDIKPKDPSEKNSSWLVTTHNLLEKATTTDEFDAVLVCNGPNHKPIIPDYPNQEKFKGNVVHSKNVRDPKDFTGLTVVVVGCGLSAFDQVYEQVPFAKKIYIAHKLQGQLPFAFPNHVQQVANVVDFLPNGVLLQNGDSLECDVVVLATGYHFGVPFLSDECGLQLRDDRFTNLYQHMINIKHPTLCLVGIIKRVPGFRFAHHQAEYLCRMLRGDFELPSDEEMLKEEEEDYQKRVVALDLHPKLTHDMYQEKGVERGKWVYLDALAKDAKTKTMPTVEKKLYDYHCFLYNNKYQDLKSKNFRILNEEEYQEINA